MIESILYIFLALLGLGVLIFVHELGHYIMARRVGMVVEVFSIGFGKPIRTWDRNGIKWQICILPFGGYVKIAGMQKEGSREPYEIPNGFFGKRPLDRIKVAMAGPLANLLFTIIILFFIWLSGGRDEPFSQYTNKVGFVDEKLAKQYGWQLKEGDEITECNGHKVENFYDLLYRSFFEKPPLTIKGYSVDYYTGKKVPFSYTLPAQNKEEVPFLKLLRPANFLIYGFDKRLEGVPNPPIDAPISKSGLKLGDRLIWINGELLFSAEQLNSIINEESAFFTIKRGEKLLQVKVPRLQLNELKLTQNEEGQIDDWKHEAKLTEKLYDTYFVPYFIDEHLIIEKSLSVTDATKQPQAGKTLYDIPLQKGDQIIAISGQKVTTPYDLVKELQQQKLLIIVDRMVKGKTDLLWRDGDRFFNQGLEVDKLLKMVSTIGTDGQVKELDHLVLLESITPRTLMESSLPLEYKMAIAGDFSSYKEEVKQLKDPQKRKDIEKRLEKAQKKVFLELALADKKVRYNPNPLVSFYDTLELTWKTLTGLVKGSVSPKDVAGPIGMVQMMQMSWGAGLKNALFFLAIISTNLGIANLLPIPILDGGYVIFSIIEMFTKKPLKSKTMERLVIPFVVLLVLGMLYVTYQDILRLLGNFFK